MPKAVRGLPKDFQLNVSTTPVELGDYLDEPLPSPSHAKAPMEQDLPQATPNAYATQIDSNAAPRPVRPNGPPRKQFNMTPETLRMVDDLLIHLRNHSVERDVRASELLHALVLAVHEVKPLLELSRIPLRGRWGSPSAAALPVAIKEAFQDAIARGRGKKQRPD